MKRVVLYLCLVALACICAPHFTGKAWRGGVEGATIYINNSVHDYSWDNFNNQAVIGDTVYFSWSGTHNVIQVMNATDETFHSWPGELNSGPKTDGGSFTWQITTNYRPGIYYFCSEDENMGCNVATSAIGDHVHGTVPPFPCSQLDDSVQYPPNCTVYEINNFQTQYDWIPYSWVAHQGDVIRWRWSNEHNVAQVDDVEYDEWNGGILSGPKDYCVPGAGFACINSPPSNGEFLWDTTGYRPGIYHFSDQNKTGMPCLIDLRWSDYVATSSCCSITTKYGTQCQIQEVTNWGPPGSCGPTCWYPYIIVANQWDLVRWRWSGLNSVYQTSNNGADAPTTNYTAGGITSGPAVNCIPAADMGCLHIDASEAQFIWEVQDVAPGDYFFYGAGDMGCIVHVNAAAAPNLTANACPLSDGGGNNNSATGHPWLLREAIALAYALFSLL